MEGLFRSRGNLTTAFTAPTRNIISEVELQQSILSVGDPTWNQQVMNSSIGLVHAADTFLQDIREEQTRTEAERYYRERENQRRLDLSNITYRRKDTPNNWDSHYADTRRFAERYQIEMILRPFNLSNTFRDRNYDGSVATFSFRETTYSRDTGGVGLFIHRVPSITFRFSNGEVYLDEILEGPNIDMHRENLRRLFLRHMGFNCVRYKKGLVINYPDGLEIKIPFNQRSSLFDYLPLSRTIIGRRR